MFKKKEKQLTVPFGLNLRWTRREQADFYRTVSSFGVVYDQEKKTFDWTQFRIISRLDKKSDESLEHYFYSFVAMCRHVCRLPAWKDGGEKILSWYPRWDEEGTCLFSRFRIILDIIIKVESTWRFQVKTSGFLQIYELQNLPKWCNSNKNWNAD